MRNNIAAHDVRISSHLAPTQKERYRSLHQVQVGIQRSAKTLQDEHANDDTAHRRIDLDAMASTQVQHLSEERTNADRAQRQALLSTIVKFRHYLPDPRRERVLPPGDGRAPFVPCALDHERSRRVAVVQHDRLEEVPQVPPVVRLERHDYARVQENYRIVRRCPLSLLFQITALDDGSDRRPHEDVPRLQIAVNKIVHEYHLEERPEQRSCEAPTTYLQSLSGVVIIQKARYRDGVFPLVILHEDAFRYPPRLGTWEGYHRSGIVVIIVVGTAEAISKGAQIIPLDAQVDLPLHG
mmetsp:Transcript_1281/g.3219  ORF Transcript_1281/g.3219 Transcript_1281/m.3219 type:complete len:296 (+) Transcript_1281:186-1073(+)